MRRRAEEEKGPPPVPCGTRMGNPSSKVGAYPTDVWITTRPPPRGEAVGLQHRQANTAPDGLIWVRRIWSDPSRTPQGLVNRNPVARRRQALIGLSCRAVRETTPIPRG